MPNIVVSDWTKERLERVKAAEGHKSLDSVIRTLILRNVSVEEMDSDDDQH